MAEDEARLEALTGLVLLVGAGAGILIMALGMALWVAGQPPDRTESRLPQDVFAGALRLHPEDLMGAGILILMATPVARVVVLVFGFFWLRRFRFSLASLVVLMLLLLSFSLAR